MKKFNNISFTNFVFYSDDTGFECTVTADDHAQSNVIFFKFNKPIGKISNNLVFVALMTLVGSNWYRKANFDLSISKHIYAKVAAITNTQIKVKNLDYAEDVDKRTTYNDSVLNLSGGIDSNALYYLLKKGKVPFHAISTNFGGAYLRDIDVCAERVELIMTTNIRDNSTKYVADQKTWEFMGIASILSIDYFHTKTILFGLVNQYVRYLRTILKDKNRQISLCNSVFLSTIGCDMQGIQFLTEFQNAIIVLDNVKDNAFMQKILDASATTGNRNKFFRKQIFLLAAKKFLKHQTINYSKYKFIDQNNKFHKRFVEEVNSRTINDKNMVLILGLKYLGYKTNELKNTLFNQVNDFSFIEDVCLADIPQFYQKYPDIISYLSTLFNVNS